MRGAPGAAAAALPPLAKSRQRKRPLRSRNDQLKVSDVGVGTWAWGNSLIWEYDPAKSDGDLQEAFDRVVAGGVSFFDTGDSYGTGKLEGRAEQLLGDFSNAYAPALLGPRADDIVIATKLAVYPWRVTTAQMRNALSKSQARASDRIRAVQLHWSAANYQPLQERCMWDSICTLYEEGLVDAVGVSNFGPKQLRKVWDYCERREVPIALAQSQYSLVSCQEEMEETRLLCADLGIQMVAYSPLGLGLLTGKFADIADDPSNAGAVLPKSAVRSGLLRAALGDAGELLATLRAVARDTGRTEAETAVAWTQAKGTLPIVGVKNAAQASSVVRCNEGFRLSPSDVRRLDAAAATFPQPIARNIFQTA